MYADEKFYLLANKYRRKLGTYLIELDPTKQESFLDGTPRHVIKWVNKLQIDDCCMEMLTTKGDEEDDESDGLKKYMVLSYKSIYINLYSIVVVDVKSGRLRFVHESYQLWESSICGFLNKISNDFIIINKDGRSFVALGSNHKRKIQSQGRTERMVHSLQSCNYMKIEESNCLKFG